MYGGEIREGRIYVKWSEKFFSKKILNFVLILYFSSIKEEVGMRVLEREIQFLIWYRESLISEANLAVMMWGAPVVFV